MPHSIHTKLTTTGVRGEYKPNKPANYGKDSLDIALTPSGRYTVRLISDGVVDKESLIMMRDTLNLILEN